MQHFLFFYYLELSIKYASIVHTSDDFKENLTSKESFTPANLNCHNDYPARNVFIRSPYSIYS